MRRRGPRRSRRLVRMPVAALSVAALAGLFGACDSTDGSSSDSDDPNSDVGMPAEAVAQFDTAWELAQCMRDHGVDRFPDPQISESGFLLVGVPWPRDAAEWNRAQQVCRRVLGDEQPGTTD